LGLFSPELTLLDSDISSQGLDSFAVLQPMRLFPVLQASLNFKEQVQEASEASARVFHDTMGQRASKGSGKPRPGQYAGRLEMPSPPGVSMPKGTEATEDPSPAISIQVRIDANLAIYGQLLIFTDQQGF
jgi:hypothetical protein